MKRLVLILSSVALLATPALAKETATKKSARTPQSTDLSRCKEAKANVQGLFELYRTYASTGYDRDLMMYIGALSQYEKDVDTMGDHNDPNFGNTYNADAFESYANFLCGGGTTQALAKKAQAGDESAIKFFLFYSAIGGVDGASAEWLGEIQTELKKSQAKKVAKVQADNAKFFKDHPIRWIY